MTSVSSEAESAERERLPGGTFQSSVRLAIIAGFLGLAVEILFFDHRVGISFLIWACLSLGGLLLAASLHGIRIQARDLPLFAAILFFAAMVFLRRDPFTVLLDVLLTLLLFGVLVQSFRSGNWLDYGAVEYAVSMLWTPLRAWWLPWGPLKEIQRAMAGNGESRRRMLAVLRGLLLAIPILLVLITLLSSADLVFRDQLGRVLAWMDLDRVAEIIGRLILIVVSALFSLGALVAALRSTHLETIRGYVDKLLRPFLGWIESIVVLGLVDALFVVFVLLQFRYLFGGESQITAAGYTYAEYARRGFGELMAASVFSLGLMLGLATWVKLEARAQRVSFNVLSVLLVGGVGVMLASSLVRLLAYEGAYGFTRLRTYSHVAILWIAALFLGFLILLLTGRLRHITLVVVSVVLGYTVSLNLLGVDSFIVRQNLSRYGASGKIDLAYLSGLSTDAVPGLVAISGQLSPASRSGLLPQLACKERMISEELQASAWPEYHLSLVAAERALKSIGEQLRPYEVIREEEGLGDASGGRGALIVTWPGGEERCRITSID
jgi:hypothetical protein